MTNKQALDILVGSLNHHTRGVFSSGEQEAIDVLKNSVSDHPKFIKLGCANTNLKEIREYAIECTRIRGQLPDGTPKCDEKWELSIWLYRENTYHSIDCDSREDAEKKKEKLDNILGVVDLEKEN